ncbi:hypothetical protein O6H91_08G039500 [Diphasiastrum complanatum]|uniref:Uncharacterized protein n=1 Tax=Diphasiastrum complanatum TaxID=34168 RepID=A0ACC2CWR3_DIPCM|nr:hypothetical protein O6H91_08G039500 [Diphasiastrum complanatum]
MMRIKLGFVISTEVQCYVLKASHKTMCHNSQVESASKRSSCISTSLDCKDLLSINCVWQLPFWREAWPEIICITGVWRTGTYTMLMVTTFIWLQQRVFCDRMMEMTGLLYCLEAFWLALSACLDR